MMTSFNLTSLSLSYNETVFPNNNYSNNNEDPKLLVCCGLDLYVLNVLIIIICILGCWGTGNVIWLLGFHIKRNPFTMYILNLTIADFGLLTVELIIEVVWAVAGLEESLLTVFIGDVFQSMYNAGQFLLTTISLDRCVSVLFPFWYRCHRPPHLPIIVCASIWVFSFLLPGIHFIVLIFKGKYNLIKYYQYTMNGFFCLPLMTISTLILFIKVCFKSQQHKRRKLLMVILLTLFFFIFLSFPLNAYYIIIYIFNSPIPYSIYYCYLFAALNSSVNPLIYFLIGRQKRGRPREGMKARLQNVFKEEEISTN